MAGIHIEDQVLPEEMRPSRRQGDRQPLEDYLAKIRAAAAARRSPDFLIIARTDSARRRRLRRGGRAAPMPRSQAGADIAFVEAPQTMDEVATVPKLVKGPCLLNVVRGGKTPEIDLRDAERMGYAIAIVPGLLMSGVIGVCDQLLAETKKTAKHPPTPGDAGPAQIFARFGAAEWDARRSAFRPEPGTAKRDAAE